MLFEVRADSPRLLIIADLYKRLLSECTVQSHQLGVIAANSFTDEDMESSRGHRIFPEVTQLIRIETSVHTGQLDPSICALKPLPLAS